LEIKDLEMASKNIQVSGMKDIYMEIPKVLWEDIGGYERVKEEIK
jgi:SpoVK/Ycf46/Vps4 family AAA+-type ATPase